MIMERLVKQLKRHEGFRKHPYKDSVGILTIGYGRNLEAVPMTRSEARVLLTNDIARAVKQCNKRLSFFEGLDHARQEVMVNMMLNMGWGQLKTFVKMIAAAELGDHELAAAEMLDSNWHLQVKGRAEELAKQYKGGDDEHSTDPE
jgi:lysozyme